MRFWLAARATGIVAFLLLTGQIVLGLVLSHPTNRSTWNLSKRVPSRGTTISGSSCSPS